MENCLIADIGGTNSRFFLYKLDLNDPSKRSEVFEKTYVTRNYKNIYQVIDHFLEYKVCVEHRPRYCVIAIAGAPRDNVLPVIANIDWEAVDGNAIAKRYNFESCRLLNDFEAVAYAFYTFKLESLKITRPATTADAAVRDRDTLLIMGYGTGLGTVLVRNFRDKERYQVVSQEGGHVGTAPTSPQDWEIMQTVRRTFKIPDDTIVSQELMCCGVGLGVVYAYFHQKLLGKEVDHNLSGKQVFDELEKPGMEAVRKAFLDFYVNLIAHSWQQMAGVFLAEGGHLLVGGIVYSLLARFFKGSLEQFMEAVREQLGSAEALSAAFDHLHLHFYSVDTSVFATEGTLNFIYLKNQPVKVNRFKHRAPREDGAPRSIIKKSEPAPENKETKEDPDRERDRDRNDRDRDRGRDRDRERDDRPRRATPDETDRNDRERKVNFDGTVSADFEDVYWSNILKSNVMTVTGFFNSRSVKSKLFLAKVLTPPTYKTFRIEKSRHRFQVYRVRFLDAECQLLVPTNVTRLLVDDIVLVNDKDRLFHSREDGWYFQTFDNIICDISVVIFNNLLEKFVGDKPLFEMDKVHSKIKFEFTPTPPFNPRPEFDPERLLLVKGNNPVKSFNVLMKVLEVLPKTWVRRSNDLVEEFTPVKVQSQRFQYVVHFPLWSNIPAEPMYGFFVKEDVILPGYLRNSILVVDDYSIINATPEYNKFFPEGPLVEVKPSQMKVAQSEYRPPKKDLK